MTTLTLSFASRADVTKRAIEALEGRPQGAFLSFSSVELLWQTMSRERWRLIETMTGREPVATVDLAHRLGRDVETVAADVDALVVAGILDNTPDGFAFPYDELKVEFSMGARRLGLGLSLRSLPGTIRPRGQTAA